MYAAEHARKHPDQPAIVMANSGEVVTYGEYEARANRLAQPVPRCGPEARSTTSPSSWRTTRACSSAEGAAERTGLYYTCINSYLSADEVAYIVNDCRRADRHRLGGEARAWRCSCRRSARTSSAG